MAYVADATTLGQHLRKRRITLGLTHREAARRLGIHPKYISRLEQDHHVPNARLLGAITAFLGYDPTPFPSDMPSQLKATRRRLGLTQAALAKALGVNRSTIQDAESGRGRRQARIRQRLMLMIRSANLTPDPLRS